MKTKLNANLRDRRGGQKAKFLLGHLVRTGDIKRVFIQGESSNWSYKLETITELTHDTIPTYRNHYPPVRYNENFLKPTNLTLDEINQVLKKLNLIQQK